MEWESYVATHGQNEDAGLIIRGLYRWFGLCQKDAGINPIWAIDFHSRYDDSFVFRGWSFDLGSVELSMSGFDVGCVAQLGSLGHRLVLETHSFAESGLMGQLDAPKFDVNVFMLSIEQGWGLGPLELFKLLDSEIASICLNCAHDNGNLCAKCILLENTRNNMRQFATQYRSSDGDIGIMWHELYRHFDERGARDSFEARTGEDLALLEEIWPHIPEFPTRPVGY